MKIISVIKNLSFLSLSLVALLLCWSVSVQAAPFSFSTGDPDGKIAMASRPSGNGKIEIETADDFILNKITSITSATFTGLLTGGATTANVSQVIVEIYRVFPKDSTLPPSGNVPTRVNSPSDVAFDSKDSSIPTLTFSANLISPTFTANNSVLNGINKIPNQTTMGEGPITGQEVQFDVTFTAPFTLPPDHYFFVPQVLLSDANSEFYWLSAPKPIVPPGTPFNPDLQTWIRNENLAPDWLRVGTDIVGGSPAPTFNASFSLTGVAPLPSTFWLISSGLGLLAWRRLR